jgi:prepilin-type N-terminal cleavage/methylation domain-containing protein
MKKLKQLIALSLLELIVALSIVSILALVSYSSLVSTKMGYRRKEAQGELTKLKALIQQQAIQYGCSVIDVVNWLNNTTTCSALNSVNNTTTWPIATPNQYYYLKVSTNSDGTITLTATVNSAGPQAKDYSCATIILNSSMGITDDAYHSTGSTPDYPDCWR